MATSRSPWGEPSSSTPRPGGRTGPTPAVRLADGGRATHEGGIGAVAVRQAPEPPQHVGDVAPEDAPEGVQLVDDDVAQPAQEGWPTGRGGEGRCAASRGWSARRWPSGGSRPAPRGRRRRRTPRRRPGKRQLGECPQLIVCQRLGGEHQQAVPAEPAPGRLRRSAPGSRATCPRRCRWRRPPSARRVPGRSPRPGATRGAARPGTPPPRAAGAGSLAGTSRASGDPLRVDEGRGPAADGGITSLPAIAPSSGSHRICPGLAAGDADRLTNRPLQHGHDVDEGHDRVSGYAHGIPRVLRPWPCCLAWVREARR